LIRVSPFLQFWEDFVKDKISDPACKFRKAIDGLKCPTVRLETSLSTGGRLADYSQTNGKSFCFIVPLI
jgi:hypothetical protein